MKKYVCIILLLTAVIRLWAQPTLSSEPKITIAGKEKSFSGAPKQITIANFTVFFAKTDWSTQKNNVGMASYLKGLDADLAQSISNKAYQYLVTQLNAKGIEVAPHDKEILANSALIKKDIKKGNSVIKNGETYEITEKKASDGNSYYASIAEGVNIAYEGPKKNQYIGVKDWAALTGKLSMSFSPTVKFNESSTGVRGLGNSSVTTTAKLSVGSSEYGGGAGVRYFAKKPVSISLTSLKVESSDTGWITNTGDEDQGVNVGSFHITIDQKAYEEEVLELLKFYIDQVIDRTSAIIWSS